MLISSTLLILRQPPELLAPSSNCSRILPLHPRTSHRTSEGKLTLKLLIVAVISDVLTCPSPITHLIARPTWIIVKTILCYLRSSSRHWKPCHVSRRLKFPQRLSLNHLSSSSPLPYTGDELKMMADRENIPFEPKIGKERLLAKFPLLLLSRALHGKNQNALHLNSRPPQGVITTGHT